MFIHRFTHYIHYNPFYLKSTVLISHLLSVWLYFSGLKYNAQSNVNYNCYRYSLFLILSINYVCSDRKHLLAQIAIYQHEAQCKIKEQAHIDQNVIRTLAF